MPNLLLAAHNAGQGKRQRDEVVEFEKNLAQNLQVLQTELKTRTYTTSAYEIFIKYEPKKARNLQTTVPRPCGAVGYIADIRAIVDSNIYQ